MTNSSSRENAPKRILFSMPRTYYYQDLTAVKSLRLSLHLAYDVSDHIAKQSRLMAMTGPQSASAVLLPEAMHIANSISLLIAHGMVLGAGALMRPMWERLGKACYLRKHPQCVSQWRNDWRGSKRPSLQDLLKSIDTDLEEFHNQEAIQFLHRVVHGSWDEMWLSMSGCGSEHAGIASGPNPDAAGAVKAIAMTTAVGLRALTLNLCRTFPLHITDLNVRAAWTEADKALLSCALEAVDHG